MKAKCTKTFAPCAFDDGEKPIPDETYGYFIEKSSVWSVDGDIEHDHLVDIERPHECWLITADDGFFDNHFEVTEK